jgi:hypothetical protein
MTRETRLKERYAALYHCLRPGEWRPAASVADQLLACRLEHPSRHKVVRLGRALDDEHFEFRGDARREEPCLTRAGEW